MYYLNGTDVTDTGRSGLKIHNFAGCNVSGIHTVVLIVNRAGPQCVVNVGFTHVSTSFSEQRQRV